MYAVHICTYREGVKQTPLRNFATEVNITDSDVFLLRQMLIYTTTAFDVKYSVSAIAPELNFMLNTFLVKLY